MQRRIFIGIGIDEQERGRLNKFVQKWADLPVLWTRSENQHLTLVFLGYVDDDDLLDLIESVKKAAGNSKYFYLDFNKIALAPSSDKPRMFWLGGEKSQELTDLKNLIEKELEIGLAQTKSFRPHITLGRIKNNAWRKMKETPKIEEEYKLTVCVDSVNVYESVIEDRKRKYIILEDCPFSK